MIDLRLANHWRRIWPSSLVGVGLVEADRARRPAIGKGEAIEIVEQARARSAVGKPMTVSVRRCALPSRGSSPPVSGSSTRMASRCIGVSGTRTRWRRVEIAGMQIGRASRRHRASRTLGHEAFEQAPAPDRCGRRSRRGVRAPVRVSCGSALVEPAFGAAASSARRQPEERQEIRGSRNARPLPRTARGARHRPDGGGSGNRLCG